MYKKYSLIFLIIVFVLLICIATTVFLIDPYNIYHMPWFGFKVVSGENRYQNAGIARNGEYDTLVLGTSMMQNASEKWYSEGFDCDAQKICFAGGKMNDFDKLFRVAFGSHNINRLFLCVDYSFLDYDFGTSKAYLPESLYDSNPLNDFEYLLNRDMLVDYVPDYIRCQRLETLSLDEAAMWKNNFVCSKENTLKTYTRLAESTDDITTVEIGSNLEQNIAVLTRYANDYPDTEFYICFPPYSILWWDNVVRKGNLTYTTECIRYAAKTLCESDNIKLFNFYDEYEIITDLDNYKDITHYSQGINYYMYECMRDGRGVTTLATIDKETEELYEFMKAYDFDSIFE